MDNTTGSTNSRASSKNSRASSTNSRASSTNSRASSKHSRASSTNSRTKKEQRVAADVTMTAACGSEHGSNGKENDAVDASSTVLQMSSFEMDEKGNNVTCVGEELYLTSSSCSSSSSGGGDKDTNDDAKESNEGGAADGGVEMSSHSISGNDVEDDNDEGDEDDDESAGRYEPLQSPSSGREDEELEPLIVYDDVPITSSYMSAPQNGSSPEMSQYGGVEVAISSSTSSSSSSHTASADKESSVDTSLADGIDDALDREDEKMDEEEKYEDPETKDAFVLRPSKDECEVEVMLDPYLHDNDLVVLMDSDENSVLEEIETSMLEQITNTIMESCATCHTSTMDNVAPENCISRNGVERAVSFSSLEIREFDMTLGNHPSATSGPPVALDWDRCVAERVIPVEEYERMRQVRRKRNKLKLSYRDRKGILFSDGKFSEQEVAAAWAEALKIRQQRLETLNRGTLLLTLDEIYESAVRKYGRATEAVTKTFTWT